MVIFFDRILNENVLFEFTTVRKLFERKFDEFPWYRGNLLAHECADRVNSSVAVQKVDMDAAEMK